MKRSLETGFSGVQLEKMMWGLRYIDDLVARRVRHGVPGTTYTPPDGSWSHADLALTLSDSMFSVRRIIGDDWASPSHSLWLRERASLEIDYSAYGQPDAIVGLATDPWVDFTGDGVIDFFDTQAFLAHLSAEGALGVISLLLDMHRPARATCSSPLGRGDRVRSGRFESRVRP